MHVFSINVEWKIIFKLKGKLPTSSQRITYFLTACKNIDFDHLCHVIRLYFLFVHLIVMYE